MWCVNDTSVKLLKREEIPKSHSLSLRRVTGVCCAQAHSRPDSRRLNTGVHTCPGECEREASGGQLRAPLVERRAPKGSREHLSHTKPPPPVGKKGPLLALGALGIGGQARWRWLSPDGPLPSAAVAHRHRTPAPRQPTDSTLGSSRIIPGGIVQTGHSSPHLR